MVKDAPEWKGSMTKLVQQISSRSDAEPFREAVDWRALGLFDYPEVIQHPMDLSLVKSKLDKNEYKTVQECGNDIRLIWKNCMTYNADGSDFYVLAEAFSKRFEDKFAKILKDFSANDDDNTTSRQPTEPTVDEKKNFAKLLFKLTKEDLGKVITDLDEKCPVSLTKNAAEDEVEINIDQISGVAFDDVYSFVKKAAEASKTKRKGAAADNNGNKKKKGVKKD